MLHMQSKKYNYKAIQRYCKVWMLFVLLFPLLSCKKYLDEKFNKKQVVPSTIEDLQAILDQFDVMNDVQMGLRTIAADEYYLPSTSWAILPVDDRLNYIWSSDATYKAEWYSSYQSVYFANTVLDYLDKIEINNENRTAHNNIQGQALFFRAFNFHHLAQLYCNPYDASVSNDPGIALRLKSDIEERVFRSTIQQTYDRIISDLKNATVLLPQSAPALSYAITRPTKPAAYAALARVYLSMRDYLNAGKYADSCLQLKSTLLDYNTLDSTSNMPLTRDNNVEIIFHAFSNVNVVTNALIDTILYNTFPNNDLRKAILFRKVPNGYSFKGNYVSHVGTYIFCGLATDEIYLTKAESSVRKGDTDSAMFYLNSLLKKRWMQGMFIPLTANTPADALNKILDERKKELIFRGIRWTDLRRFNVEGANISLSRVVNGTTYSLPASDLRWVMLVPLDVINLSGIQQNPR